MADNDRQVESKLEPADDVTNLISTIALGLQIMVSNETWAINGTSNITSSDLLVNIICLYFQFHFFEFFRS